MFNVNIYLYVTVSVLGIFVFSTLMVELSECIYILTLMINISVIMHPADKFVLSGAKEYMIFFFK